MTGEQLEHLAVAVAIIVAHVARRTERCRLCQQRVMTRPKPRRENIRGGRVEREKKGEA